MDLSGVTRDVVVPVRLDPTGEHGPTLKQARGPRWRRTSYGLHVPSAVDPTRTEQRIVEAAAALPEGGAVTGWAALHWRGARWFDGLADDGKSPRLVPLWVGHDRTIRPVPGTRISEEFLKGDDVELVDGLRVTVAVRAVFHEVRSAASLSQAVRAIDMAVADDLVSLDELNEYAALRLVGLPGVRRLRLAISLADENCWSPAECSMRGVWTRDGRHPRPLCNRPLFSLDGDHLFTPDLFDPVAGVAGEYDGSAHLDVLRRSKDLDREELYREYGIELVTMMGPDLRDAAPFLRRLDSAYRRARERTRPARRAWTLEQPHWWVDTSTVARRRALDDRQRRIWLRRQAA